MNPARPKTSPTPTLAALSLCLTLFLTLSNPIWGQSAGGDLPTEPSVALEEEIVVSASLMELPKHRLGSSVTVIDRQDIEARNKDTVLELLRTVPGLEVATVGGPGKATSVFIRGGSSSHTLVTIDGRRVNDGTTGAFDFADLTADNLERIEVVRGPQGLVHGSEAVAGSIHIITRRGQGPTKPWVRAAGGSDGYSQFGAGVSGGDDSVDYSLSVSRIETDGVSAADEAKGNSEDDPWTNLTVSGRVGTSVWGDGRIEATVRHVKGDTDVDGFTFGIGPTDDLNAQQERSLTTATVSLRQPINEVWTQSLTVGSTRDELLGKDPDDFFSNFEIVSRNAEVRTQADLSFGSGELISVGYAVERREAENVGSFDESLDIRSLFVESLWTLGDDVDLSLGARRDDHSVFGDEATYRAAISARLGDVARLHGSFGTGFKAPTFSDLFFPGFGNPDLLPETSEGFDLGLELAFHDGRVVVDLTYFDTDFEDLILFTFPAGFVNLAEASSSGVELTLDWQASELFQLQASHTFNETEDLATGLQLARRPEQRTTLSLFYRPIDKLRTTATVVAVSDRIDADGSDMDDYERVDLSVDYQLTERWRPFVRAENLLGSDYSEIPGYTSPGLTLVGGLSFGL